MFLLISLPYFRYTFFHLLIFFFFLKNKITIFLYSEDMEEGSHYRIMVSFPYNPDYISKVKSIVGYR